MMRILVALSLVFGLIAADPIARLASSLEDTSDERGARLLPDTLSVVLKLIYALIGDKITAIGVAVSVIKWLVSHSLVIALGAVVAIGFCKLTNKCLKNEELIPVSHLRNYVTPQNLETAEKFLANAVKRYVEDERLSWTNFI